MKYTLDDLYIVLGEDLTDKMVAVVGKENVAEWFYQPNKVFKDKSPNDLWVEGDSRELERVLTDIITAAHGG